MDYEQIDWTKLSRISFHPNALYINMYVIKHNVSSHQLGYHLIHVDLLQIIHIAPHNHPCALHAIMIFTVVQWNLGLRSHH